MTDKPALLELAERCERAMGPDRELDAEIANLDIPRATLWRDTRPECRSYPPYTASLDASMSLVPRARRVSKLEEHWRTRRWHAQLSERPSDTLLKAFDEGRIIGWNAADTEPEGAATPALALTSAALRALAEQGGE